VVYFIQVPRLRAVLLGCLPLFGWLLFSLLYYGFPFPNPAYAKLNTHIPVGGLMVQGLFYFKDLLWRDPLTLLVIAGGFVVAVLGRNRKDILMAVGISLYLLYIIIIGGDYMSGRFFTAPLLGALVLWLRSSWFKTLSHYQAMLFFSIVLVLSLIAAHPVLWPIETERRLTNERGITDERLFYEEHTGLLQNLTTDPPLMRHWLAIPGLQARDAGAPMLIKGGVGLAGFYAGPDVYVLDTLALADLLSARLPVRNVYFWRIGHFKRVRPAGYDDTLRSGQNQIGDPNIAAYYDALSLIARGPLLDPQRIVTIWRMNTGQYDHLIDADEYVARHLAKTTLTGISTPVADGTPLDAPEVLTIPYEGIEIDLGEMMTASVIELSLDTNYEYRLAYLLGGTEQGSQDVSIVLTTEGLQTQWLIVPEDFSKQGFDMVRIFPKCYGIDKKYQRALGHFILHDETG
jgi:arabinofuranosyltransferase